MTDSGHACGNPLTPSFLQHYLLEEEEEGREGSGRRHSALANSVQDLPTTSDEISCSKVDQMWRTSLLLFPKNAKLFLERWDYTRSGSACISNFLDPLLLFGRRGVG